jgi:fucose permease
MQSDSEQHRLPKLVFTPRRNALLTLLLAYAGFVALGMVNSLVGVAWPSIRDTFGLPLDALGAFLLANTAGYMLASAVSGRLIGALNTGALMAGCCGLTGLALLGIGSAPAWAVLVALGFVAGLSGGAIDGGMNSYAATHFSPQAMNWLHACFGIGATLGPAIMTAVITGGLSWRVGYAIVAAAQLALAAAFGLTRRLWDRPAAAGAQPPTHSAPLAATLRLPLAWLGIALFFVFCGIEIATGNWIFSLLTEARGVSPALAGAWVSLYWASLTVGRIVFGFVVQRVAPNTVLRWCMAGAVLSALLIWVHLAPWLTFAGIALMGLTLAPQFPLLISATPGYLGPQHANNGVGFQVAVASLGGALLPSLIGVLARARGLEVLGPFLFVAALIMTALFELLVWRLRRAGPPMKRA